jgi:hypothetical protein
MPGQCQDRKPDGSPCRATPLTGSAYCWFHAPERAEQRREAQRAGARTANARPDPAPVEDLPLRSVADVAVLLAEAVNAVRAGRMEPKVANAVAVLTAQLMNALRGGDLEARIRALEERERRE